MKMDPIETFGRVYFPNPEKDEIEGARLYTDSGKIFLEFEYAFRKKPDKTEIILGTFNKIGKVTCIYNRYYGGAFGSGGNLCKYRATYMFTGHHFFNLSDLKFNKAIIPATSLFEWFSIRTIKFIHEPIKALHYDNPEKIKLNINETNNASFTFGYQSRSTRESFNINEDINIRISFSKPKPYTDFIKILIKFKKLFSFISVDTLNPETITFYNNEIKYDQEFNGKKYSKEITYYDIRKELNPCPTSRFLEIKYDDIKDIFPNFIEQWILFAESNPTIDFLLEKAYNNELSSKTYFLNTCFALEIFHKEYVGSKKYTDDEFKYIKTYLKEKVKDSKACKWLQPKLSMGNHPSLRDRLNYFNDEFKLINNDPALLINQIIHTRNHLVHSGAKKQYIVNDDLNLYVIAITMETIIKGAVLKKLGVNSNYVLEIYKKANTYLNRFVDQ